MDLKIYTVYKYDIPVPGFSSGYRLVACNNASGNSGSEFVVANT